MRIDFVIAGTQKGGTTALHGYLGQHAEIGIASIKEVHFFDHERNFLHGRPDYDRYHSFFDWTKPHKVRGEATPVYMYWHSCARRLRDYNPDLKMIMVLRDPIHRAYSNWQMERARGRETAGFREAVLLEAERCREVWPLQHRIYPYVDRGFYSVQLQRIWQYFPRRQTLVLRHEDLLSKPADVLDDVCGFLEVDKFPAIPPIPVTPSDYVPLQDMETHQYLKSIFWPEVRTLESFLGWDCEHWLELS